MPPEVIDLTASDDESNLPQHDDIQELSVRRIGPEPDPDDALFVSQSTALPPRRPPARVYGNASSHHHDMPVLMGMGSRDTPPAPQEPSIFSQLGRRARTGHRPVSPRHVHPHAHIHSHAHSYNLMQLFGQRSRQYLPDGSLPPFAHRFFSMPDTDEDPDYSPWDDHAPDIPAFYAQMNDHMHAAAREHDIALQRAMARSMLETSNREPIDHEKIKKPPMAGTSKGYTRNMNEKCDLLCAKCDNILGEGEDKKALVYFRNCGHVYCGGCVEEIGKLKGKHRQCSALDCEGKKRQKIVFKQVYI